MSDDRDQLMRDLAESLNETEAPETAPLPSLNLGPGVYDPDDVSVAAYVADPCSEVSLRSSDLRRILRMTPAHFRAHHPRLSEKPAWAIRKATKSMDAGTIVHALVLGHGSAFAVINPADYKTKDGKPAKTTTATEVKDAIAAAESRGLIVLSPKQNDGVQRTASALREQIEMDLGRPIGEHAVEHTIIWEERTAHGPVLCRVRPDLMAWGERAGRGLCVEIKGTATIELDDGGVQTVLSSNHGAYLIQAAWQLRGMRAVRPDLAGRIAHRHYLAELSYPNLVAPVNASLLALEQADRRCRRAVERFAEWRESGLLDRPTAWPERIGNLAPWLERLWMVEEEEELGATPEAFV